MYCVPPQVIFRMHMRRLKKGSATVLFFDDDPSEIRAAKEMLTPERGFLLSPHPVERRGGMTVTDLRVILDFVGSAEGVHLIGEREEDLADEPTPTAAEKVDEDHDRVRPAAGSELVGPPEPVAVPLLEQSLGDTGSHSGSAEDTPFLVID